MSSGPVNSTWNRHAAALLIFTTAIGTACIAPVRADTTESACTPYTAILAPGTWETNATADPNHPVGMLAPLGQGLERKFGSDISVVYVPYSASASDQGLSYDASKASLVSTIDGLLSSACATTQFVLAGYSQGADGMGDVAADIGNGHGPVDPKRVLGVALLSDPHRDPRTEQQLGTTQPGSGIAGTRPDGFGALTSRVRTVCGQGDLYCSANDAAAPFISSVGKILDGDAATGSKQGQLSSSMVSDWSQTNLPGLGSTVSSLENSARTLPTIADPSSTDVGTGIAGIDSGATSLVATLKPVQDLVQWVKNTPGARDVLSSASPGSPQAAAGQILNTASRIDLGGAINTAVSLANTAQQLLSPAQSGTAPSSGPNPRDALMPGTEQLAAETAPLSSLNSSTLTAGLGALQLLKPDTILDQITAVGGGIAQTAANIPQILSDFLALPQKIAAGDITGAHQVAGELNNLFSPLVKAAAGVNLGLVAQLVDMAAPFDPSGYTAIAGLIVGVLARLDIVRIANDLGQAQETLWAAVDKLAHGDVLGAGAQMTGLAPVGVDLAAAVAAMFTGGSKEDPSELAQPGTLGAQRDAFVHAVSTGDLAGMATALIQVAGAQGLSDISTVVGKGLQAADYFASNPHTDYSQGKQELQTFLEGQIRS